MYQITIILILTLLPLITLAEKISATQLHNELNSPIQFDLVKPFPLHPPAKHQLDNIYKFNIQPNQTTLVQHINQAIMQKQWDVLIELLLQYQKTKNYDHGLLHYALATFYYHHQQYNQAIEHYQKLLSLHPDAIYPRFDFAIALFNDYQYKQAEQQLQYLHPLLSGNIRNIAAQYLTEIKQQQRWQSYLNFQYVQTDNVNQASSVETINLYGKQFSKTADSLPQKAQGIRYEVGITKLLNLTGHHFIQPELNYNGVYYWNNQEYNEQSLYFGLSYLYQQAFSTWQITPFIQQNWFSNTHYNHFVGNLLSYAVTLNSKYRWHNQLKYTRKFYTDPLLASRYNGSQYDISTLLSYPISSRWLLFAGITFDYDLLKEKSSSSKKWQPIVGMKYENKNWGNSLSIRYTQRTFNAPHYLFQYVRKDQEYQVDYAIWHHKLSWQGFLPKLHFRYQNIDSNIPAFYSRKNQEWFITLNRTF